MRVKLLLVVVLGVIVSIAAATAGARVMSAKKTTTITFWDAYSTGGAEVQHLEKIVIPAFEKTHPGIVVSLTTIPG